MPQLNKINLLKCTYGKWLVRTNHVLFHGNKTYCSKLADCVTSDIFKFVCIFLVSAHTAVAEAMDEFQKSSL